MRNILYIIVLLALISCKKDSDGFRIYTVKQGKHYCQHEITRTLDKHSIQFEFKVNDSWNFGSVGGWSKIAGITEGGVHKNSCRLGYRNDHGVKEVGMYVYADGERYDFVIDTVQNGTYYVDMGHVGGEWVMHFNGNIWRAPAGKKKDIGVLLYPYIGGKKTIGHDWIVPIKFH